MKTPIYYAILHKTEECYKICTDYNQWAVKVMYHNPITDVCVNITEDLLDTSFETEKEAIQWVTQIQKPVYYAIFGNDYELVKMEPYAPEFITLMNKREKTMIELFELMEEIETPWYKKIGEYIALPFKKIINALC